MFGYETLHLYSLRNQCFPYINTIVEKMNIYIYIYIYISPAKCSNILYLLDLIYNFLNFSSVLCTFILAGVSNQHPIIDLFSPP
jgi:hypothetical protein